MEDDNSINGTVTKKVYVKFGAHETDEMPKEWAEQMLTIWRQRQPAQFARLMGEVVTAGLK